MAQEVRRTRVRLRRCRRLRENVPMSEPETTPSPMPAPRSRRRGGTPLDMVRSLGLVGVIVVLVALFNSGNQPTRPPVTVDVAATVQAARASAGFPVLAESALPARWYANGARFEAVPQEDGRWAYHVGYSDGEGAYLGIDATNAADPAQILGDDTYVDATGNRVIAGVRFLHYAQAENDVWMHAATATEPFTILIGANRPAELEQLITALRTDGLIAVDATTAS